MQSLAREIYMNEAHPLHAGLVGASWVENGVLVRWHRDRGFTYICIPIGGQSLEL